MLRKATLLVVLLASLLLAPLPVQGQAGSQFFPETGYAVADSAQGRFLSEFSRLGGSMRSATQLARRFKLKGSTTRHSSVRSFNGDLRLTKLTSPTLWTGCQILGRTPG